MNDETPQQEQGTALVVVKRDPFADAFNPSNMEEAGKMANWLAKSTLIPDALRGKPGDLLVVLITGRELGLSTMQSLRQINVIRGKAVMAAELMVAKVVSHADVCRYFRLVESDDERATYETLRSGAPEPSRLSYSMREAAVAGLADKSNWKSHPAAMLRARCSSALARAVYPDLVAGIYCQDEGEEIQSTIRPLVRRELEIAHEELPIDGEIVEPEPEKSSPSREPVPAQRGRKPNPDKPPTEKQLKRLWAICNSRGNQFGVEADDVRSAVLYDAGLESAKDIPNQEAYQAICQAAERWRPPDAD